MKETTILQQLLYNADFQKKTIAFLKPEYFRGSEKVVFDLINAYMTKYNAAPTQAALYIDLDSLKTIDEHTFAQCKDIIGTLKDDEKFELQWLLDTTEKFCQEKAVYNALYNSISIIEGKNKQPTSIIPELLKDALAVSFDSNLGHDYLEDAEERWEYYNNPENKIPFGYHMLDKITNGGPTTKSLSIFMGGVGFGKTMLLCNLAGKFLEQGHDVLYFTLEMSEQQISKRIDANLLDCELSDVQDMTRDEFLRRIGRIKAKTQGKLIVKEFSSAHAGHFRHVIHELKLKKRRKPTICMVDYMNLCGSSRVKLSAHVPRDLYFQFIAEELRALMVEEEMAGFSATQTNREGFGDTDPSMTNTSHSFGVPATVDLQIAIVSNEELTEMNQALFKQIKNRFGDVYLDSRFAMGVDRAKQRFYDVDDPTRDLVHNNRTSSEVAVTTKKFGEFNGPVFDRTKFAGIS